MRGERCQVLRSAFYGTDDPAHEVGSEYQGVSDRESRGFAKPQKAARRKTSYLDGANANRDVDSDATTGSAEADKTLGH